MNTNTDVTSLPVTGLHNHDGVWVALTHSASKTFKTEQGAAVWLARRGYDTDGSRLAQ